MLARPWGKTRADGCSQPVGARISWMQQQWTLAALGVWGACHLCGMPSDSFDALRARVRMCPQQTLTTHG